jgi:alginate O-acetyltransferase complex protein AlgI
MSFMGIEFLVFMAIVFFVHWHCERKRQVLLLLGANLVFYCLFDWRFAALLLISGALNFVCGANIDKAKSARGKKSWLLISLAGSLGILVYFKYFNFFAESISVVLGAIGVHPSLTTRMIVMPLGISFYTFQALSYTIDIYRGQIKPTRSILRFETFVSFFPLIAAGPITRARQLLPQLEGERSLRLEDVQAGLSRFLNGLCKKLFIADTLSFYLVDPVFSSPEKFATPALWLAMPAYAVQIYADFSGYSSMAIGAARLLGFKIPENFNFPYLSTNIAEFWRRWHITLSRWLRDYLWWTFAKNIPIGGKLISRMRRHFSLFIVFVICGLWHGASWTMVGWGAIHGMYLVIYDIWHSWKEGRGQSPEPATLLSTLTAWTITQAGVCFAWILFRSNSFADSRTYFAGLLHSPGTGHVTVPLLVWAAFAAFAADHLAGWLREHYPVLNGRVPATARGLAYAVMIIFLFHGRPEQVNPFIYFQF